MLEAAKELRGENTTSDPVDVGVSFDGSWQRLLFQSTPVEHLDVDIVSFLPNVSPIKQATRIQNTTVPSITKDQLQKWSSQESFAYSSVRYQRTICATPSNMVMEMLSVILP